MDRPNILFIALDDLNEWIGCLGVNPDLKTPNLDRLAAEGVLFTNACCPAPVCNPSRTAFLTGLRPTTTGCYLLNDNLEASPERDRGVPFPLYLRRQGYRSLCVGKVDHGGEPIEKATRATFGESMWDEFGGTFGGQQFGLHSRHTQCLTDAPGFYSFAQHWGPLDDDQAEALSDVHVANWACEQLKRDFDSPFLLAAGFYRPHVPHTAPRRFFDMYDKSKLWLPPTGPDDMGNMPSAARQVALSGYQDTGGGTHKRITDRGVRRDITQAYLACVSFMDDCVGRVLKALTASQYADNTIVVLCSDNGWGLGEHFHWKKWSLFDNGSRVPLIIKAPGMGKPGTLCEQGVDLTDIYPTLIDLCGLPDPGHLEGESLRPLLTEPRAERERPGLTSFGPANHSLRTARWRYTRYCDRTEELYDYAADPWEHRNLADDPDFADIKGRLARWLPEAPAPAIASSPAPNTPFDLQPGQAVWFRGVEDGFAGQRLRISATLQAEGDGIVVHHAGLFAGYALYIRNGHLCMTVADVPTPLRWDRLQREQTVLEAPKPLPERLVHVEAIWDTNGELTLKVDGSAVATGKHGGALSIYPSGILEAGRYTQTKYPPSGHCAPSKVFPGVVKNIRVTFSES
jgi:iduronate 2-sulfatase